MANDSFWSVLEQDLSIEIPIFIKNTFDFAGYGHVLVFQDIGDTEIESISSFVKQNSSLLIKTQKKKEDIFGEFYATNPDRFEFRPGDIQLIKNESASNKVLNRKEEETPSRTHYFLQKLQSAADQNMKRDKGGFRYGAEIKYFASYLRMLIGPYAYETLQKKLSYSLPSLPSTNRYMSSSGCNITEGILRNEELAIYLAERSLEPVVCISEDATRITESVRYDSKSNQLVGFVLPLHAKTGSPIPFAFPARDSEEILHHFSSNNAVSSFLNVIMAQPMANVPPFCLMVYGSDNKYSSLDVVNRWMYIKEELAKVNIKAFTFSSDSDPKYNKAMRLLSGLGVKIDFPLFSCVANADGPFYFQDTIHIATKLRNFLLRTIYDKRTVPFGKSFIRIEHLYAILRNFTKDRHELTLSTLNPVDRQNFKSVLRICDTKVTDLLTDNIDDSQATVTFLQIMRDIIDCFMDVHLTPVQRLRKIWYSLFLIRIWREFILSSKNYTLKNNFLSVNCYACVELNAHSLVSCMIYLNRTNKPELFKPYLFQSQVCEKTFRQLKSMSTVLSTVINCTMKEAISRFSKIQFQNHILKSTEDQFIYPRAMRVDFPENKIKLPTPDEIYKEIEFCQSLAIATARKLGLIKSKCKIQNYVCKINPSISMPETKLKPTVSHISSAELSSIQLTPSDLKNIQLKNYAAKVKPEEIEATGPYVQIQCSGDKQLLVKKTSLCWLLSTQCNKLSSDRLLRVMHSADSDSNSKLRNKIRRRHLLYPHKHITKKRKQKL